MLKTKMRFHNFILNIYLKSVIIKIVVWWISRKIRIVMHKNIVKNKQLLNKKYKVLIFRLVIFRIKVFIQMKINSKNYSIIIKFKKI